MSNKPQNELEMFAQEVDESELKEISGSKSLDWNKLLLPVTILIAAVLISGVLIFTSGKGSNTVSGRQDNNQLAAVGNQPSGPVNVSADDDAFLGNKDAPVTIIEFSDFQCPFCRRFWSETLPQIKKEYIDTGKVKFVYRDFPLSFHAGAQPAAEGTECAREQGKFWELHDKIFEEQAKQGSSTIQFNKSDVVKWASRIGLNTGKFNQCLDSGKYKQEVEKDIADGTAAGVTGTPATFINGRLVVGAQPFAAFKIIIDEELKKSK